MIDNLASQMRQFETRRGAAAMKGTGWDRWFDAVNQQRRKAEAAGMKFEMGGFGNLGDMKEQSETQQMAQAAAGGDRSAMRGLQQREALSRRGTQYGGGGAAPEQAMAFGAAHFSPTGERNLMKQYAAMQEEQSPDAYAWQRTGPGSTTNMHLEWLRSKGIPLDLNPEALAAQLEALRGA